MVQANMLEAKNNLSGFVRMIELGEEDCVVIARRGKPVAKLVRYEVVPVPRKIGIAKDSALYSDGWDDPSFNAEIAASFGGAS